MQADPAARPTHHLQYIDSLRGIAVAAVLGAHTLLEVQVTGMAGSVLGFASKGVQLFYVVSALTLMMSMNKRNRSERHSTLNFFIRRFFRIAPAFWLVLLFYCVLGSLAAIPMNIALPSRTHLLLVAGFLNGWRPDIINKPVIGQWSIAVEVTFYLLLPLLFPLLTSLRRAAWVWSIAVVLYIFSSPLAVCLAKLEGFTAGSAVNEFAYFWFPSQLNIFMCGVGLYFIVTQKLPLGRSMLPHIAGSLAVLLAHRFVPGCGLLPLLGVALMAGVALLARHPFGLLVNRATSFLGKVSFSAYLCHPLFLPLVKRAIAALALANPGLRFVLFYILLLALVLPVSWLLWRLVELPFQEAGRRLIVRLNAEKPAAV